MYYKSLSAAFLRLRHEDATHKVSQYEIFLNNKHLQEIDLRRDDNMWPLNINLPHWNASQNWDISINTSDLNQNVQPPNLTSPESEDEVSSSTMDANIRELYRIAVPILLVACFVSFLFNLTIVCSVRFLRRKLSPTICLSLSLAMADAFASLVVGLGFLINSLLPVVYGVQLGPFSRCFILSLEAFRLGGLVVTALHLLVLAVNHYIGILKPLHYAQIVTRKSTVFAIALTWIFPIAFFLVYFASIPGDGFQSENCSNFTFLLYSPFRTTTSAMFFCPLVLMTVMYTHMFVVVRRHQRELNRNSALDRQQVASNRQMNKNVKAIVTTLLILGTYVLGWMPAVLIFVVTCLDCALPYKEIPTNILIPITIFTNSMIVSKSFVDPIIYVVRMPEIKSALRATWITRCGHVGHFSATPNHSRTDTRRSTFVTSRRKSKLSTRNGSIHNGATNNIQMCDHQGLLCNRYRDKATDKNLTIAQFV